MSRARQIWVPKFGTLKKRCIFNGFYAQNHTKTLENLFYEKSEIFN